MVLSLLLLWASPLSVIALWVVLVVVDLPPTAKLTLYVSVLVRLLVARQGQINKWNISAMSQRTELPPLGLHYQVSD